MYAAVLGGVLGFIGAVELGYQLVGLAVYWGGILTFVGIWKGTSVQIFDERDVSLERRTSLLTFQIAGIVGVLWMSTLVVLNTATTVEVPARVRGGFLTLSGLFVLYGVVYLVLRYHR
jgi:uncharacterized membrane protein